MDLKIDTNCVDASCTAYITGEVDVSNAEILREKLTEMINEKPSGIVVDLSDTPYIDSTGIGVIMGAAQASKEQGCSFALVCPHENILRVFNMLGVDQQIDVRTSR